MIHHLFRERDSATTAAGEVHRHRTADGTRRKIARPKDVGCVIGDGAFNYNPVPACLGLAQQYGVPILVVICNNQGYVSQEWNPTNFPSGYALREHNSYGRVIEPTPDYAAIAPAFGAHGECVSDRVNWNRRSAAPSLLLNRDASRYWTFGSNREARMADIALRPGQTTLAQWRAVYRGARVTLDPACHDAVAAGARAVEAILARGEPVYGINTGFGRLASIRIEPADLATLQRNIVLSHSAGVGEPMPAPLLRLMLALKLASLGQGASGARLETVQFLAAMLSNDLLPIVPTQGSVGASGDLAPLAHMAAAMIGGSEIMHAGERKPAAAALAQAGMQPIVLGAKEGLALLNGTQFSTAYALAGLFEAETLLQAGLITGALSTDAARGSDAPFDPRIHALRGHRGQIDVARVLREMIAGSAIRASHLTGDDRVQDPYCLRCQPQVMGAALDILRHAAATLQIEANGVSDNPLICGDPPEALSGGNFHGEPVAFAADIIALALCEIGAIAERRIAMLIDPALSRLPAFLTPSPGLNSGFMVPQVTAAALVAENRQRATPASVDSIPTSANQEDHVSMSAHAARRLLPMADNVAAVIGIELLAATQGCDFHAPLASSATLERVRAAVRAEVAHLDEDREMAPDIARAIALVRSGRIALAAQQVGLPGIA